VILDAQFMANFFAFSFEFANGKNVRNKETATGWATSEALASPGCLKVPFGDLFLDVFALVLFRKTPTHRLPFRTQGRGRLD